MVIICWYAGSAPVDQWHFVRGAAALRPRTFRELGRFFRFEISSQGSHKLIATGLYAYARHPAYSGMLSWWQTLAGFYGASGSCHLGEALWECVSLQVVQLEQVNCALQLCGSRNPLHLSDTILAHVKRRRGVEEEIRLNGVTGLKGCPIWWKKKPWIVIIEFETLNLTYELDFIRFHRSKSLLFEFLFLLSEIREIIVTWEGKQTGWGPYITLWSPKS